MEGAAARGVLSHLSQLEVQARCRRDQPSRVKELRAEVEALRAQRDLLKAEIETHKNLQKLRASMDREPVHGEDGEEMDVDSENSQPLQRMARLTQLRDLLCAHRIIGGYNIRKTLHGRGVCVSLATGYKGTLFESYNLELDLKPTLRISRHDIPPFIPLNSLTEGNNLQTDMKGFLDNLSQHLNAYVGRRQQLKLVKELHDSVEVMESNVLCSILVMLLTVPRAKTPFLCTLQYTDHTRCLPTKVDIECKENNIFNSSDLKNIRSLLLDTPVHKALATMRELGQIM